MNHQPLSLICEELLLDSVEQCLFCCRASYVQKAWFDQQSTTQILDGIICLIG